MTVLYQYAMPSLTTMLLAIAVIVIQRQRYTNDIVLQSGWSKAYDYVIIGAGASGSVIASRLSEDPDVTVLLLETGEAESVYTTTPNFWPFVANDPSVSYQYEIVPQKNALQAFVLNSFPWNNGKLVGGSASHNAMNYNRGNPMDFNNWNASGWRWDDVFPLFLRMENNNDPEIIRQNPMHHARGGPVDVTSSPVIDPFFFAFMDAANRGGYPTIDINGPSQLGTTMVQRYIQPNGVRESTASAYLEDEAVRVRKNLHIVTLANVTRILFDDDGKYGHGKGAHRQPRAVAVEFLHNYKDLNVVGARREVILSAGAIRSPHILMNSGVGPSQTLQQFGIPIVADLPAVGQNLQDHIFIPVPIYIPNPYDMTAFMSPTNTTVLDLYNYLKFGAAPLSTITRQSTYFTSSVATGGHLNWPDIMIDVQQHNPTMNNLTATLLTLDPEHRYEWAQLLAPYIGRITFMGPLLMRPKSRGIITLASRDPLVEPLIDPRYLSHPDDIQAFLEGMKETLRLFNYQTLNLHHLNLWQEHTFPGCPPCPKGLPIINCDEYLICIIQGIADTYSHYTSTCKLRSYGDPDHVWVVDERLRVQGIDGLRVADASIMPEIVNANTNAASIVIGEKASDLIREDNGHGGGRSGRRGPAYH